MKFNIEHYLFESIKELVLNGKLVIGLLISIFPVAIAGRFGMKNVTEAFDIYTIMNLYCTFCFLTATINSIYLVNRAFNTNTIFLINNTKRNRVYYVISNTILAFMIAIIYMIVGVVCVFLYKDLVGKGELNGKLILGFALNIVLVIPTYYLLCHLLFLLGAKSGLVYTLLTVSLLFIPDIIAALMPLINNRILCIIIQNTPLYYLPLYGGAILKKTQYSIGAAFMLFLFGLVIIKNRKYSK